MGREKILKTYSNPVITIKSTSLMYFNHIKIEIESKPETQAK